jgi:2-haloacid dehalogenase
MKYEVIIFDADETLFDFKRSERESLKNTMQDFNIEYDEEHHLKIYKNINASIWKELEEGLITQKELNFNRFRRFAEKLNLDFDALAFTDSYTKHLSNASFIYEDSIELLEMLHKRFRLIMVTNGLKDIQDIRIKKSVLAKYFEVIIVSEEVQVAKPDKRIFEIALNSINYTDKRKVLIVGDSLSSDIQGGINAGIDTCWYNPSKAVNRTGIKPTYEIAGLKELVSILAD